MTTTYQYAESVLDNIAPLHKDANGLVQKRTVYGTLNIFFAKMRNVRNKNLERVLTPLPFCVPSYWRQPLCRYCWSEWLRMELCAGQDRCVQASRRRKPPSSPCHCRSRPCRRRSALDYRQGTNEEALRVSPNTHIDSLDKHRPRRKMTLVNGQGCLETNI